MTFDTAFERSHKPNSIVTNEKDYKPVHTPVYTQADLDKARKEEREAALKEAIAVVMKRGEIIHRGNLVAALEAAATEAEEAGGADEMYARVPG